MSMSRLVSNLTRRVGSIHHRCTDDDVFLRPESWLRLLFRTIGNDCATGCNSVYVHFSSVSCPTVVSVLPVAYVASILDYHCEHAHFSSYACAEVNAEWVVQLKSIAVVRVSFSSIDIRIYRSFMTYLSSSERCGLRSLGWALMRYSERDSSDSFLIKKRLPYWRSRRRRWHERVWHDRWTCLMVPRCRCLYSYPWMFGK